MICLLGPVSVDVLGLDYESRSGDIDRIDWSMALLNESYLLSHSSSLNRVEFARGSLSIFFFFFNEYLIYQL